LAAEKRNSEEGARSQLLQEAKPFLESMRQIHLHVADRPDVLQLLVEKSLSGRAYFEALRERKDTRLQVMVAM
jgi:hypothetical protein